MNEQDMRHLIGEIGNVSVYQPANTPLPQTQRCIVLPNLEWDPSYVETSVGVTLPPDLTQLGDADLVLVRADAAQADFGSVMIALPLDPRDDWYRVTSSVGGFLREFLEARGDKFWERRS